MVCTLLVPWMNLERAAPGLPWRAPPPLPDPKKWGRPHRLPAVSMRRRCARSPGEGLQHGTARSLPPVPGQASGARGAGPVSDGELLGRFVAGGDAAAFETLLARHGPTGLVVCRCV